MKQLDKLMAKSFVGPFIVTFGIALFVLLMQILWLYLDDIAGKGLSFFLIMELLAYKCVGLVPLALPLAILISSVMVLGNLAEHYELSSFKSSGVGLMRVIAPLVVFGCLSAGISYACSDYIIPAANLQFGARMYDIQQKKPTLNMEPGVFNEDFNQFTIRLGGRANDGRAISDVLIYDQSKANVGELSEIMAERGEMFTARGGRFLVMRLFDGNQYVEQRPGGSAGRNAPFMRTSFDTYTKLFDLNEFQLERHASSLFSTNRDMLSSWQLRVGVDSIDTDILVRKQTISNHLVTYLPELVRDTVVYREVAATNDTERWTQYGEDGELLQDSLGTIDSTRQDTVIADDYRPEGAALPPGMRPPITARVIPAAELEENRRVLIRRKEERLQQANDDVLVRSTENWPGVHALLDSLPEAERMTVYNRARSSIRSISGQSQSVLRLLPGIMETRVKYVYSMHTKYSMAVVCIIFVFIGAPMGAIVRKGGFGYPILVSIIFFVIYIILTIFCRKLAESFVVSGAMAGWLPCIILFPISLWITWSAMNDVKLVDTDRVGQAFRRARDSKRVAALRRAVKKR